LAELAAHYATAPEPKGEIVVVVGPPAQEAPRADELDAALADALASMTLRDAVAEVTARTRLPRSKVYARALELSRK
jgi:16S rRNA (cytidine1402-2'-O)-methyltransferase